MTLDGVSFLPGAVLFDPDFYDTVPTIRGDGLAIGGNDRFDVFDISPARHHPDLRPLVQIPEGDLGTT